MIVKAVSESLRKGENWRRALDAHEHVEAVTSHKVNAGMGQNVGASINRRSIGSYGIDPSLIRTAYQYAHRRITPRLRPCSAAWPRAGPTRSAARSRPGACWVGSFVLLVVFMCWLWTGPTVVWGSG